VRYLRQFGAFLYDFLVGDAWELFVGPIVVLVVGWALVEAGVAPGIVGLAVFAGVVVVAFLNLAAALRNAA
jgi:hypothetical protein